MLLGQGFEDSQTRLEGLLLLIGTDGLSDTVNDVADRLLTLDTLVDIVQSDLVVQALLDLGMDLGNTLSVGSLHLQVDVLALGLVDQGVGVRQRL